MYTPSQGHTHQNCPIWPQQGLRFIHPYISAAESFKAYSSAAGIVPRMLHILVRYEELRGCHHHTIHNLTKSESEHLIWSILNVSAPVTFQKGCSGAILWPGALLHLLAGIATLEQLPVASLGII